MKNKLIELIKQYEDIIIHEKEMLSIYENIGNKDMVDYCIDKIRTYEKVVRDLKGVIK